MNTEVWELFNDINNSFKNEKLPSLKEEIDNDAPKDSSFKKNRLKDATERFIINNDLNLIYDKNYSLKLYIASHNFRLFNFNDIIYGIGGQSLGILNYEHFSDILKTDKNQSFIEYHKKKVKFLDKNIFDINHHLGNKIYDPNHYCPYFANGLYLFKFSDINNNIFSIENTNKPIISGVQKGRFDGHYGKADGKTIIKSKNGLSVFDCNTSVIFNNKTNFYYLFQRSNFYTERRYIQYSMSKDLIEWSKWYLLKINPMKDYFKTNFYINNFFKIKNVDNYIGILQFNIPNQSNGFFELYYSYDCVNWDFIGNIGILTYHKEWIVLGEPLLLNNKYFFFIVDDAFKPLINVYSIEKNRFSFITNKDINTNSTILFKPVLIKNNQLIINFKTYQSGFIKIQLLDISKNILLNFNFDNFDTITENKNEFDYIVSWNNNINIDYKELVYVEIIGHKFKLFSINI